MCRGWVSECQLHARAPWPTSIPDPFSDVSRPNSINVTYVVIDLAKHHYHLNKAATQTLWGFSLRSSLKISFSATWSHCEAMSCLWDVCIQHNSISTNIVLFTYRHSIIKATTSPRLSTSIILIPILHPRFGTFTDGRASCRYFRQHLESVTTGNNSCNDQEIDFTEERLPPLLTVLSRGKREMSIEAVAWKASMV